MDFRLLPPLGRYQAPWGRWLAQGRAYAEVERRGGQDARWSATPAGWRHRSRYRLSAPTPMAAHRAVRHPCGRWAGAPGPPRCRACQPPADWGADRLVGPHTASDGPAGWPAGPRLSGP